MNFDEYGNCPSCGPEGCLNPRAHEKRGISLGLEKAAQLCDSLQACTSDNERQIAYDNAAKGIRGLGSSLDEYVLIEKSKLEALRRLVWNGKNAEALDALDAILGAKS